MNKHFVILVASVVLAAGNVVPNPAFETIVANVVLELELQHNDANRGLGEIAGVVMVSQLEMNNVKIYLQPQGPDRHPLIDFREVLSPQVPVDYVNFIVAIVNGEDNAEQQILPKLQKLLKRFRQSHQNQDPAQIILYSRVCPSTECTNKIIKKFQELNLPESVGIAVICTSSDGVVSNPAYSWRQFAGAGVQFFRVGLPSNGQCSNADLGCHSIQSYLMNRIGNSLGCCLFPATHSVTAEFINRLMSKCHLELATLETCLSNAAIELLGGACSCLSPHAISASLSQYINEAMITDSNHFELYFVSYPLDPLNPTNIMDPITSPDQLNNYEPFKYTCTDIRRGGLLCTSTLPGYVTAGNTVCNKDTPCGYYGYDYNWCYVDSGSWEYCCTDVCDYRGEAYRWCNAGSEWEYCGYYFDVPGEGLLNKNRQGCLPNWPCGKHDTESYYYYCYIDNDWNWDWCCSPDSQCSPTGGTCYTGDSSYGEEECTYGKYNDIGG